jgi:hypothetical protein
MNKPNKLEIATHLHLESSESGGGGFWLVVNTEGEEEYLDDLILEAFDCDYTTDYVGRVRICIEKIA